ERDGLAGVQPHGLGRRGLPAESSPPFARLWRAAVVPYERVPDQPVGTVFQADAGKAAVLDRGADGQQMHPGRKVDLRMARDKNNRPVAAEKRARLIQNGRKLMGSGAGRPVSEGGAHLFGVVAGIKRAAAPVALQNDPFL